MSKLAEFRQLQKLLAEQLRTLENFKSDSGLKKEIEFEVKLRDLMAEFGYNLKDAIKLLDPHDSRLTPNIYKNAAWRKPRQMRVCKNPQTGYVIETKGGNHKKVKEYKSAHGYETVESWLSKVNIIF